MKKIYVSLGSDCLCAITSRNMNKRTFALPFDWVVTYNGVSDIIKEEFINFLPKLENTTLFNPLSNTYFRHNKFPDDYDKMNRRIKRFMDLLKNETDEIIFIRHSHHSHHHQETSELNWTLKNDIVDGEELYILLKEKYPKLNFKIIVILSCWKCFNIENVYHSENIKIYNIITQSNQSWDKCMDKLILQVYNEIYENELL